MINRLKLQIKKRLWSRFFYLFPGLCRFGSFPGHGIGQIDEFGHG